MHRMKFILSVFIFIGIIFNSNNAESAFLTPPDDNYRIKAFYTENDLSGWDVVLKGQILSLSAKEYSIENAISEKIQGKTKVTVRLYNYHGLKIGDILYVINSRNLIIAKLEVKSIYYTGTFGYILIGTGNLRLANTGDRVVQKSGYDRVLEASTLKSRGDYFQESGQTGNAISCYKRSLELDSTNPEAHLELGYIYLKQNMLQFAFNEFNEARKQISRLYDNEDKFMLLKGMAEVRFYEVYFKGLNNELRNKYIEEGIIYSKEALQIYPESKDVNFFLGMFYFDNKEKMDVEAKKQFLKVIDLDPEKVEAYIALSRLYERHDNKEKARQYAEEALRRDPANDRAKYMYNKTK